MMAAAQPFLSGAISKTVNMPADTTAEEIAEAYVWGWKMGLKALAIYRDGSKQSQPLSTKSEGDKTKKEKEVASRPRRERLPDTRQSLTHKFNVGGHEGYINVGLYPDGRPGELFIIMAKEGSTVGGLMDCFGTAISICLQYGVPPEVLVNKFSHTRFEPMGHTTNPDVRIAKSVVDYIFRWLGITFLDGYREASNNLPLGEKAGAAEADHGAAVKPHEKGSGKGSEKGNRRAVETGNGSSHGHSRSAKKVDMEMLERAGAVTVRSEQFARFQSDAPSCDNCGAITVRNGNCYLCHNCGNSMGCS
jgi:ribonucleoside-diphosphate reductase alpha chain